MELNIENKRWTWYFVIVVFTAFCVWMALGAYQSHFLLALRMLGDTSTKTLIGAPKEGRGDEWATYLPILKQAYREGFPEVSALKPYYEKLNWFISIPHANFSLLFLPNQIAYWTFSGPVALSLQGFYYNALFLVATVWFLSNIGVRRKVGIVAAFAILFSQFFQMWWTSNFPALGGCILPFAIITSGLCDKYKFPLLFLGFGHVIFGEIYPPFYVSIAVALVPFMFAARPDLLTLKNVSLISLSAVAALTSYLILNWDFVHSVANTTYPGRRINTGGGSSYRSIVDLFFPTVPDSEATVPDGIYEFSVAGTFLPLIAVASMSGVRWSKDLARISAVSGLMVAIVLEYMLVGFPVGLAKATGFFLVPAHRMALGLSLLVNFYSALIISRNLESVRLVPLVIIAMLSGIAGAMFHPTHEMLEDFFGVRFLAYVPLLTLIVMGCFWRLAGNASNVAPRLAFGILICTTIAQILTFGYFNPVMRAGDILKPVDNQFTWDWWALYKKSGNKPFATVGNYGHVLRGEGLPALEAIHLANVSLSSYEAVFSEFSPDVINGYFNAFRGIGFADVDKVDASGATVIFPIEPFANPFAHVVLTGKYSFGSLASDVNVRNVKRIGATSYVVRWSSLLAKPLDIDAVLKLHLDCSVQESWMTRYPVEIPEQQLGRVALRGMMGRMVIHAEDEHGASSCVSNLKISL